MTQDNLRPMSEEELREIAAQEAALNARHDLSARQNSDQTPVENDTSIFHDAEHPAVTGTGTGDNRDETGDPEIAASLGGVGGAMVGIAAGLVIGPIGAAAGAVVGGLTGMGVSGLAVDAIDRNDDDTTLSGMHDNTTDEGSPIV